MGASPVVRRDPPLTANQKNPRIKLNAPHGRCAKTWHTHWHRPCSSHWRLPHLLERREGVHERVHSVLKRARSDRTGSARARESVVLTVGCVRTERAERSLRRAAIAVAAVAFLVAISTMTGSAQAQDLRVGGCIGHFWSTFNCVTRWGTYGDPYVRDVPQPSDADKARAMARDKRWADRCRPYIAQDRYGVARYHYALPGCEFGIGD